MFTNLKFFSLTALFILTSLSPSFSQEKKGGHKKSRQEQKNAGFLAMKKLVESRRFVFDAEMAFPVGGQPVNLLSNSGQLVVLKDMVYASLPYVGQSHVSTYGTQNVGMDFKGRMHDVKVKVVEKKRKIYFSFRVTQADAYNVSMEILYDGGCSVSIISQRKSSISYSGVVTEYKEKE
jgi:hypothetical protein